MAVTKKETSNTLSEFARRAAQRLEARRIPKKRKLFVPSLDEEITIRSVSKQELLEITNMDEGQEDNRADKYTLYLAVVEPSLKDVAVELKDAGLIKEYLDVVDMFEISEVGEIAMQVMELSGVIGNKKVTVVDDLKK